MVLHACTPSTQETEQEGDSKFTTTQQDGKEVLSAVVPVPGIQDIKHNSLLRLQGGQDHPLLNGLDHAVRIL